MTFPQLFLAFNFLTVTTLKETRSLLQSNSSTVDANQLGRLGGTAKAKREQLGVS